MGDERERWGCGRELGKKLLSDGASWSFLRGIVLSWLSGVGGMRGSVEYVVGVLGMGL